MSRSVKEQSLAGATSTGDGTALETGGRITVSLFVVADTSPGTLDVQLEVSMDGTNFVPYQDAAGNGQGQVVTSDFADKEGNGSYAAFATVHGLAAEYVKPRITAYSSAGNVDVWVAASNNPPTSMAYRETGSA